MFDNNSLYGRLCYLHRQLTRENAKLFTEHGLSPVQVHALIFIYMKNKAGEKVCQKDVEKRVNLRPSSVSTLLTNLENGGFIVRTVAEGDARTRYLEPTEKGKYICIKDKLLIDSCDDAIENALESEEKEELLRLLKKIIDSISG